MTTAATAGPRRKIDWLPYVIGAVTIFVLVAFLLYPIFKTVLFSFVKNGEELAFGNLTLINFRAFLDGLRCRGRRFLSRCSSGFRCCLSTIVRVH